MYARTDSDLPQGPELPPKPGLIKWAGLGDEKRPIILCEYAHAMGNSLGNLRTIGTPSESIQGFRGLYLGLGGSGTEQTDANGRTFWAYGGDFGDEVNDRQFCINGLVFPDRSPHPTLLEAKRCQQPFTAKLRSRGEIAVVVTSEHLFRATDNERLHWQLVSEDRVVDSGDIALELLPGETRSVSLFANNLQLTGTRWLNVWITQVDGTEWSDPGHEVARWQFTLTGQPQPEAAPVTAAAIAETPAGFAVDAGEFWLIDADTGLLTSWIKSGEQLLHEGLADNFVRAPLDNDIGTSEAGRLDLALGLHAGNGRIAGPAIALPQHSG